jgi:hypothetical protein
MAKKPSVALTAAEKTARRRAEEALRTGLPVCEQIQKHLANVRRKMNRQRYGRPGAMTLPATVTGSSAAHSHCH